MSKYQNLLDEGYKIISPRRAKRVDKEKAEKNILKLEREEISLYMEIRNLPLIELEKPFQSGWMRFFVLREDVSRCIQAELYQNILDKINTTQYHRNKQFKVKKRRLRKRIYVAKEQKIKVFTLYEWLHPKNPLTQHEKSLFRSREVYCKRNKTTSLEYFYPEPWRFVLKVKPHMITHVKMIDLSLESRLKLIDNYFTNHDLRRNSYRYVCEKPLFDPLKNRTKEQIQEEFTI